MRLAIRIGMAFVFIVLACAMSLAQSEIITTYAGLALPVNDSLAAGQAIDKPLSVAPDGVGGFFVGSNQNRVYRVTTDGRLTLVAGNGTAGYGGDGGPATSAQLFHPAGIAVDKTGNLFIADCYNNRIRKITPGGVISTVAGTGDAGYSGDGGVATSAKLNGPTGVATDTAGNLFIADYNNYRVRKVTPGGKISAIEHFFGIPIGVATDVYDNLYIVDYHYHCIDMVTPGGTVYRIVGTGNAGFSGDGGPAASANLSSPTSVTIDANGNLFIMDTGNRRVRKVTLDLYITTVAGNGTSGYSGDGGLATSAQFSDPTGVAVDTAGNLFIADTGNNRVRKITSRGVISTAAGNDISGYSGDGGLATYAKLNRPASVVADIAGNVFIADTNNYCIRKVTPDGIVSTVAGNGTYGFSGDGGPAVYAQFSSPAGVAVDAAGNLFIADSRTARIRKVTPDGVINTVAGGGTQYPGDSGPATAARFVEPIGIAVDAVGNLYITDYAKVRKVTPSGVISTVAGNGTLGFSGDSGPATLAKISSPKGVAIDLAGNVFIADTSNCRVRKVTPDGVISTVAGGGTQYPGDGGLATSAMLDSPYGVAVNTAGTLYIADTDNSRIRKVASDGIISTIAGYGVSGYSGDGGPAAYAQLDHPTGIAVDTRGRLFVADTNNSRVRKIFKEPSISTNLTLQAGGGATAGTAGSNDIAQAGYAKVTINSGTTPYGTAVFSIKQDGVTVSEAGVPASPPTVSARVFIDYRSNVHAVPGRSEAGVIDISTGIAVVNYGVVAANVTYTLRNASGSTLAIGHGTIAAGKHFGCFINQLQEMAALDFILPAEFQSAIQFGTLDIASDQPLSVLSLRGTTNQRKQFLITTTPVADLAKPPGSGAIYFPQLVDGGGYTTSLILMNTSTATETGTLQIMDNNGAAFAVNLASGASGSIFNYSIPPNGIARFQTNGSSVQAKTGWIQLIPDTGTSTPMGSGIFTFNPVNVLVTESGVPGALATTHARIYLDRSEKHNTGLAIANIGTAAAKITVNAFQSDGITAVGTSNGPLSLAAHGHEAKFADQFITGLQDGFTGVLDVSSSTPFTAVTVRSLYNENSDFLMTTFPIADVMQEAPSPIVFPQIADGGGYITQFILVNTGGASSTTIHYYNNDGIPLAVGR
jgi:sugar lactone lactonase YvrE